MGSVDQAQFSSECRIFSIIYYHSILSISKSRQHLEDSILGEIEDILSRTITVTFDHRMTREGLMLRHQSMNFSLSAGIIYKPTPSPLISHPLFSLLFLVNTNAEVFVLGKSSSSVY